MDSDLQIFSTILKQYGYSVTNARITVFRALHASEPQSLQQLQHRCKNIDRASVYRSIALFEQHNIVNRVQLGWKYKIELSDLFTKHHHHLHCTNCGKIVSLNPDALLESRVDILAKQHGFVHQNHQLEVEGLCQQCVTKVKSANEN